MKTKYTNKIKKLFKNKKNYLENEINGIKNHLF